MSGIFIFISSTLALISPVIYAKAIVKGKARPHRTTRLVLLFIAVIATGFSVCATRYGRHMACGSVSAASDSPFWAKH